VVALRQLGLVSHLVSYKATAPGEAPSHELLGIADDSNKKALGSFYDLFLFTAAPATSTWKQPTGQWAEWQSAYPTADEAGRDRPGVRRVCSHSESGAAPRSESAGRARGGHVRCRRPAVASQWLLIRPQKAC
jgi:hypothetical protein